MIVLSFETDKEQQEILDRAIKFFTGKMGLEATERSHCCVIFGEVYKSYVMVTLNQKNDKFEVVVESKEYDYWAKKFVAEF